METPAKLIGSAIAGAEAYSKTTYELTKLRALEVTANAGAHLTAWVVLLAVWCLGLCMASTGLALWLGERMGKAYYGFFIVAGGLLIAGILIYLFLSSWIAALVSRLIVGKIGIPTTS